MTTLRACVLGVFALLLVAPNMAAAQADETPVFEPAPCPFSVPSAFVEGETVECGYLVVPEDRAVPDGRTIRLAVAIFHPGGDAAEPDPILYLEGGPGGSPLKARMSNIDALLSPLFPAQRDIILFDQRGVGYSEPALECPDFVDLYLNLLDKELDGERLTGQQVLAEKVAALESCAADLSEIADLTVYNTANSAADVNDLRIALGYEQVNLWGSSYGTRLALEVMRDYPDGVRSVLLDAPYTPEADLYLATPGSFDRALTVLVEACADDPDCNRAYPDLRDVLFEAYARLNETPVSTNVLDPVTGARWPVLMDGDMLMEQIFRALYMTDIRPVMPRIIYDARDGQFDTLLLVTRQDVLRQYIRTWGMYFSVLCHEEIPFSSWTAFQAAVEPYPEFVGFFDGFEVGGLSYQTCPVWGAGVADARENEPVVSDIPTLITTGEYDPIVPPTFGAVASETLSNSHFYVFPGIGHGAIPVDDCPVGIVLAFWDDPSAALDDSCLSTMAVAPFELPATETTAIELEPFTNELLSVQGVAPVGWTAAGPGVFTRVSSATDVTALIQQAAPVSADQLLGVLTQQLGLSAAPESVGEYVAGDLTWTLYATSVQGVAVDIALAEAEGTTLIVVLNSAARERDALYEQVFVPVLDALMPLEN